MKTINAIQEDIYEASTDVRLSVPLPIQLISWNNQQKTDWASILDLFLNKEEKSLYV